MTERGRLSIRSNPALFAGARRWLGDWAERGGFRDQAAHELSLALTEACTNVYRHSYGRRTDGRIDLEVELDERALTLTVRDFGARFDPERYTPPPLGEPREGGYGVYLIGQVMDEVRYPTTKVGTCVVMVKARPSAKRETQPDPAAPPLSGSRA